MGGSIRNIVVLLVFLGAVARYVVIKRGMSRVDEVTINALQLYRNSLESFATQLLAQ
jgi:hypothetical protein